MSGINGLDDEQPASNSAVEQGERWSAFGLSV